MEYNHIFYEDLFKSIDFFRHMKWIDNNENERLKSKLQNHIDKFKKASVNIKWKAREQ